jgi:hypothetical protein
MPLLLFNSRKLSGVNRRHLNWIQAWTLALLQAPVALRLFSAASRKYRGQTVEDYRSNGRADRGRDR